MKFKVLFFICLIAVLSLSFVYVAQAPRPYRGFSIGLPELVEAAPGELLTINGTILNFGWWWLHDFNLTATGLPEDYTVIFSPQWFEHVRILREWNPERGVYIIPEKFSMSIKVPENVAGIFSVNVTGQEFMSWKKVSNSTSFILRVSSPAKFSISDIVVPETVTEFQPFNITFDVKNEGAVDQFANISVVVPSDWKVSPEIEAIMVKANTAEPMVFTITPTNTTGEISVLLLYPYKAQILNITKVGPALIPKVPPIPTGLVTWFERLPTLAALFERLGALPSWVLVVILVFLIIIVWNAYKILRTYKFRIVRKKPEEMKKQVEPPASDLSQSLQ